MTFTKLPKAISAEELLSTPLPPVKWIIPGLLPAGLALFAGPSKAGKSWLTLWLCLQIAQGNPVWNREIEPRTVIYFSLEDTFNRLQSRIFQLIDGGDAPERLILQTECPSIGQGLEEQVESLIHTYCDVGLIVIDTLQKVRVSDGNGGMYANDYKEAGALKKIADKYGICILLIHHLRKQTASDPFDQISGSTGLMGVADTSWVILPKKQQPRINRPELERIWKDTEKILAEHAFVHDHKFPSLQAIVDYRKGLSRQIDALAAQRSEVVKQMRRKDAPSELADRRAVLTCKIAELRKEDKIAEGAIKRIQRTHESNRIDQENRNVQRGVVKLSHQESITKDPKTTSGDRMVYLSKEMCQLLKAWRKECEWDRTQTANETVSEDDYLFRQPNGKPMCPSTFTYRFKLILKANNLPLDLSVHSLRHTNASLLIAQGVDVRTVASLLGHAQASTTLDIYAHAFDKNKRKAQEKLGKAIGL